MKTRWLNAVCLVVPSSAALGSQVRPPRPNIVFEALSNQAVPPKLKPKDPNFKTPTVWGER
jgi:hypothetical protein